jgi:hypothetical protein
MTTPPTHDPLDYIRILQETVTGSGNYASGFPILKELLQNAEDSQASHFDYGYCGGIQSAQHPLLKCPGVFSLSNGYFNIKNARKIAAAIGGSSKVSEENSIGKFGLGLKSIFNLCEAFFYISDQPSYQDDYDEFNGFNFFNPWSVQGKDLFHDWKIPKESDRDLMLENFDFLLKKEEYRETNKNCLLTWIPLRLRDHKPNKEFDRDGNPLGCIREEYFDSQPDFLSTLDTQHSFAQILPMLSSVECIRFWENTQKESTFQITYKSNGRRRTRELAETPTISQDWSGNIEINETSFLTFWGVEKRVDTEVVNLITKLQERVRSFGKLQPHVAIVISYHESSECKLIIWPAVFLPVGNQPLQTINLKPSKSYQITLHGNFIPSKERTSIEGVFGNSSDSEKAQWNKLLCQNVLSLFLDSLNYLSKEVSVDEINILCEAILKNVTFFREGKEYILKEKSFVCAVTKDLKNLQWQLVDNTTPILGIPTFSSSLSSVFPVLNELKQKTILFDKSKSNLINKNTRWQHDQIQRVIETLSIKAFVKSPKFLRFLTTLLNDHRSSLTQNIEYSLVTLLKKIFLEIDSKSWQVYKNLIDFLKPYQWISIKNIDDNLFKEFYKNPNINIVVIPEKIRKNDDNSLNSENGFYIFQTILSFYKDKPENILDFVLSVFAMIIVKEEKAKFINLIQTHKFIQGSKLSSSGMTDGYYSIQDINGNSLTFLNTKSSIELASKLSSALQGIHILFVHSQVNKLTHNIKECDRLTCLRILASQQFELSSNPKNRKQLLEELVK